MPKKVRVPTPLRKLTNNEELVGKAREIKPSLRGFEAMMSSEEKVGA
jgi:hypothetical protein